MPRGTIAFCTGLALLLLAAAAAGAHDLWIEPSSFTPAPATRFAVRLFIGQLFRGDTFPRDPKLLTRFAVLGSAGETEIPGVPDTDPAGFLIAGPPGLYELVYTSRPAFVQLDAAKFEHYLGEEGLREISQLRVQRGQTGAAVREMFSRCAKSLIAVGGAGGTGFSGFARPLGLTLEVVPEKNPYTLGAGQELPVRLLYRGVPLASAQVEAVPKDQPSRLVSGRTDRQGRIRLRLDKPGTWMVKAVHMIAAPAGSGADWESFWASLTFALPAR
jgi:uncharacterized GH25 family protein